ncbi:MAG: hypothetical protein P8074_24175 [Anaerolineales bacterium]
MDDKFLSNFQEPPRPEFAEALYQKLNAPSQRLTHYQRIKQFMESHAIFQKRLASGFSLALLILLAVLVFSPLGRAYAQEIFARIGNLFISDAPTYAERFENKLQEGLLPTSDPNAEPETIEWQPPALLTVAEASSQAGFEVYNLVDIPAEYELIYRGIMPPNEDESATRVSATWQSPQGALVFSQTKVWAAGADPRTLPVGEAPAEKVSVQGVEGIWIEGLRLSTYVENNTVAPLYANLLIWEKDGFEFWLQSSAGLSQAEMLTIANSATP